MIKIIYLFILFFLFSCNESSIDISGCTDPTAINYNSEANIDDESCQYDDDVYFDINISETGQSTLFIFLDTISSLNIGDEVGVFDQTGIIDSDGTIGEILVGSGVWNGNQLEIVTIGSINLFQFGGPILPGYIEGNNMVLKIWNGAIESDATYVINEGGGAGLFNGIFTTINSIILD